MASVNSDISFASRTIHVHAPSRLASASVGVRVGGGVGVSVGVGGFGTLGEMSLCDTACMDETLHDVIVSVPACDNSRLQGFTDNHDDSCARKTHFSIHMWSVVIKSGEKQSAPAR